MKRDGQLNISREGVKRFFGSDLYHVLMSASWPEFFSTLAVVYLVVNLVFAGAYSVCGRDALAGIQTSTGWRHFVECFFFSVQTLATIGYGRVSPVSLIANALVTAEAFLGLFGVAVMTGLLFTRFSRPTSRVVFSDTAIIGLYDGRPSFFFRVANARLNQIAEARINVALIRSEITKEGERLRRIVDLKLERSHSPVFALSWLVIHVINEASPLFELNESTFAEGQPELLVTLSGVDETFSQTIQARFSYTPEDVVWNRRFKDVLSRDEAGRIQLDITHIHDTEETMKRERGK